MKAILLLIQTISMMLPAIQVFVKAIEDAVPATGQGAAKMQMVKDMTASAFATINQTEVAFEQVWPSLQVVVTSLVAMYNAAGIFKKVVQ